MRWRWPIRSSVCCRRTGPGRRWCCAAISLGFIVNMAFVIVSRTAMVTIPIMLAVFALLHLKWRTSLMIFGGLGGPGGIGLGPHRRSAASEGGDGFCGTIGSTRRQNVPTSIGLRLEFWQKSLRFFADAPVIGHGTGSTRGLFERAATGDTYSATSHGHRQSAQPDP